MLECTIVLALECGGQMREIVGLNLLQLCEIRLALEHQLAVAAGDRRAFFLKTSRSRSGLIQLFLVVLFRLLFTYDILVGIELLFGPADLLLQLAQRGLEVRNRGFVLLTALVLELLPQVLDHIKAHCVPGPVFDA